MPARLNMNPIPYISWKGRTLTQITSHKIKNGMNMGELTTPNFFLPQPLKIYRREIATGDIPVSCNDRNSTSIDVLNMPNGYIITEQSENHAGLVHTLENIVPNNTSQNGDCKEKTNTNVCTVENARRRVRSSGMIKRAFKPENNNDNVYFTNTTQYLVSRNRTFKQNQYTHIRKGETSLLLNSTLYNTNVYSPNGLNHCKTTKIIEGVNDTFYYLWTNFDTANITALQSSSNPEQISGCVKVVIPAGDRNFSDIQGALNQKLLENHHYYINTRNNKKVALLKIIFNSVNNKIELQSFTEKVLDPQMVYNTFNNYPISSLVSPNDITNKRPTFYFPANSGFANMIGFPSGQPAFYPDIRSVPITNDNSVGFLSNTAVSIFPLYDILHFKPSNSRFATQGAVSSSDRVLRVKYDTITRNGATYQNTFGCEVPSAMAYNVSGYTYRLKDKIGFPGKRTPIFSKYSTAVTCVSDGCLHK
jgi:hypothetical protein